MVVIIGVNQIGKRYIKLICGSRYEPPVRVPRARAVRVSARPGGTTSVLARTAGCSCDTTVSIDEVPEDAVPFVLGKGQV